MVGVTRHESTPASGEGDSLPDWVQHFTEGFVEQPLAIESEGGTNTQDAEPEVPQRPISKPTRKHTLFTHFLKDPTCDGCNMTKHVRARCRKRIEMRTDGVAPPTHFEEVIPAHLKVLSEDNESKMQHGCDVLVQDFFEFGSRGVQPETRDDTKILQQFLPPSKTTRNNLHR